jgi:Flp pilus assembly secretin CpaC
VELAVGQQRVFALEGVSRVSLGGDSVAAEPLGEERLLLVGRRAGRSELVLLFADGRSQVWRLRVVDDAAARFRDNCAALLGTTDCAGLQVVAAGDELVLEGRVDDLQTYHRLRSIRRAFPEVRLLVEVDPAVLDGLVRAINAELAAAGLDRARVTRVGGRLLIEGTVAGAVEKRKAAAIVAAMLDQAIGG